MFRNLSVVMAVIALLTFGYSVKVELDELRFVAEQARKISLGGVECCKMNYERCEAIHQKTVMN